MALAYRAGALGGTAPVALNAADEVAVDAFLAGRLPFSRIPWVLEETLAQTPVGPADSVAAVDEADRRARKTAGNILAS